MKGPRQVGVYLTVEEIRPAPVLAFAGGFLLLVMITVPLSGRWDKPPGEPAGGDLPPATRMVRLAADGSLTWDGDPVDRAALANRFESVARLLSPPDLIFEIEGTLPSAEAARLLELATRSGVRRAALVPVQGNVEPGSTDRPRAVESAHDVGGFPGEPGAAAASDGALSEGPVSTTANAASGNASPAASQEAPPSAVEPSGGDAPLLPLDPQGPDDGEDLLPLAPPPKARLVEEPVSTPVP